jgi:nucleotide-binding universal stress UspA family protein
VKQLAPSFKLKNIVFASTFKEDATHALQVVTAFCELFNCNLHLLFVNMISHLVDEKMARLTMKKAMEELATIPFTANVTETNDKEFGIDQFAKSIDADMIAVAMERQSTLGRLLSPALALQLINHSELPVLVVNPPKPN